MTTTPSASPNTMSPLHTLTPAHSTGTSRCTILARTLGIERADPAVEDRETQSRESDWTSRTKPSVMQPAAPRACAAVDNSSPQGAIL